MDTGKCFSVALSLASTNPQYDIRLFTELQVQYMKIASAEHAQNMCRTYCVNKLFFVLTVRTIHVYNMFCACPAHVLPMFMLAIFMY